MNQLTYPPSTKNHQRINTRNKTNHTENIAISYQKGWELAFDLMEVYFGENSNALKTSLRVHNKTDKNI